MKIAFCNQHPYWGTLGNDGGTRTILLSINVLREQGHEVCVVANKDNHTWVPHKPIVKKIPADTDICIAVSASAIQHMRATAPKSARLAFWMRGFEKWQMGSGEIYSAIKKLNKSGGITLTNSTWLTEKLMKHDLKSDVVFAGLDLSFFTQGYSILGARDYKYFGAVINKKHKTKRADVIEAIEKKYKWSVIIRKDTSAENMRFAYRSCDSWLAPTELEGFHNVAAEACLCGCVIICNKLPSNGMGDYANEETAMRYDRYDEIIPMIRHPDYEKVWPMQDLLREKIGSRDRNMKILTDILSH